MSAFRRIISSNMIHMKNVARNGVKAPVFRCVSTDALLDSKERGDETRFIRKQEQLRAEEMRKNVERIMALKDSEDEKAKLLELIEPKKEPSGFVEKYHLNKWNMALPLAVLTILPLMEASTYYWMLIC